MKKFECPCGSKSSKKLFDSPHDTGLLEPGERFRLVECGGCGVRYTDPWPDHTKLKKFYVEEYYGKNNFRFNFLVEFFVHYFRMGRVNKILDIKRHGKVLDIGVGRGMILYELKKRGWTTFGTEQSEKAAYYSKKVLGLDIHVGDITEVPLEPDSLDAVTFWHVLEHLADPFSSLRKAHELLKPGGLAIVAIPNVNSFQAMIFGKHWFHLDMPLHLFHFSDKFIIQLLEKNGFEKIKINHFSLEFNPFGFLQSFLNKLGFEFNLLYNILKSGQFKKSIQKSKLPRKLQILAVLFLAMIVGPFSLVVETLMSILKKGGTIEIFAQKKKIN